MDDDSYMMGDPGGPRHSQMPGAGLDDFLNDVGAEGQAHHYLSVAQAEATFNQVTFFILHLIAFMSPLFSPS